MKLIAKYLKPEHKNVIEKFDCSDEPNVEIFLKEYALEYQQTGSAVTRLYFDYEDNLIGYFTLFNDVVLIDDYYKQIHNWNLPEDIYVFPSVRIHFLGVDKKYRNKGYGRYLLVEAATIAYEISQKSGCNFLIANALPSAKKFYEKHRFTCVGIDQQDFLPIMALRIGKGNPAK